VQDVNAIVGSWEHDNHVVKLLPASTMELYNNYIPTTKNGVYSVSEDTIKFNFDCLIHPNQHEIEVYEYYFISDNLLVMGGVWYERI
jgi:hypothetical protein